MQNSIETRGNLCTEPGPPVVTLVLRNQQLKARAIAPTSTVDQKWGFALFGSVFAPCFGQIVSIRVLKLSNTNLVVSRHTCLYQERLFLRVIFN